MVGVVSISLGSLHQRFGFNRVLASALLFYGVAIVWIQESSTLGSMTLSVALLGLAHGCCIPSMVALYTRLAPEGMTGSYVILNSLVFRLGQTVGPVCLAAVLMHAGIDWVFVVAGLLVLPMSVLALFTRWRDA
jgi:predicted MFS family arabinose efflux permease